MEFYGQATKSKEETIIGQEKEQVEMAYVSAAINKLGDDVTDEDLQNELDKSVGAKKTLVTPNSDGTLNVLFNDTEHNYNVNNGAVAKVEPMPIVTVPPIIAVLTNTVFQDISSDNKMAVIPKGFKISSIAEEQEINSGLVVIAPDGSEFVWVPASVESMANKTTGTDKNGKDNYQGKLYTFSGKGDSTFSEEMTSYGQGTTSNREPSLVTNNSADTYAIMETITGNDYDASKSYYNTILGYNVDTGAKDFGKDLQQDYNAMIDSVKKYGGFYIGRYETSISGKTVASTKGTADTRPMASINWYNMYKKQKEYASKNNITSVESSMVWGSQWDCMLNWALTGSDKGKVTATSNAPHDLSSTYQPGTQANDKLNNIYDLEGNVMEWTLEAKEAPFRLNRGR